MKGYTRTFFAMGGPCTLKLYSESQVEADDVFSLCVNEVLRLEAKYSRYREDSTLSRINSSAGETMFMDSETELLLNYAHAAYVASAGRFDVTSGIYRKVWDFKNKVIPSAENLNTLKPYVGWEKVKREGPRLVLLPGMELDFGGIVKEYAADCVNGILKNNGIKHALVELAGDIVVTGPHPDGRPWEISIQHPDNERAKKIYVHNGAVASSGDYERYFLYKGKRYCHILNPKTGMPITEVAGVTVVAPVCVVAGTLCTSAMLHKQMSSEAFLGNTELSYVLFLRDGNGKAFEKVSKFNKC